MGTLIATEASALLKEADPKLGQLIGKVGPCLLEANVGRSPFEGLIEAVAHQQLHGKAAKTILGRFLALYPGMEFPTPEAVLRTDSGKILGAGFSRAKTRSIQAIARMTLEGVVPDRNGMERMEDEEIIDRLTQVPGIGRWSAEMFLIFGLGRLDVLPVHDYGIQQGFAIAYRKRRLPDPKLIQKTGEGWRPYRTVASWYLWRATDLERALKA